jgi:hypothetical protein
MVTVGVTKYVNSDVSRPAKQRVLFGRLLSLIETMACERISTLRHHRPLATAVPYYPWSCRKGGVMRRSGQGFSIVDFLIIVALLLIVIGMFGPRLAQSRKKANNTAVVTAPAQAPVRPAR